MSTLESAAPRPRPNRPSRKAGWVIALCLGTTTGAAALCFVGYVLWPRWPNSIVAADAPPLPITVGGVTFNIPPAAIRVPVQQRPGQQDRIDLVFTWPNLEPPEPAPNKARHDLEDAPATERLFVSIAAQTGTLSAPHRLRVIYSRYTSAEPSAAPDGLIGGAFRDNTPYAGEDLFYAVDNPDRFVTRCTRAHRTAPGSCLYETRLGAADIIVRFPRAWLGEWRAIAEGIEHLLTKMRPRG